MGGVLLSAAGCVERDLEQRPGEGYVEIAVDWNGSDSNISNRDTRFLFYDTTGRLVKEQSGIRDRFEGVLPAGSYRLVVHNTDSENVEWRGCETFEQAEVYARQIAYTLADCPSEAVCIAEPGQVYAANVCNESATVEVTDIGTTRLSVTPQSLTHNLTLRFSVSTYDGEQVASLAGAIDGVSPGYFPGKGCCETGVSCAQEFTAAATGEGYAAEIELFGFVTSADSAASTNRLYVSIALTDGEIFTSAFDMTAALKKILADNGGTLPRDIALDIELHVRQVGLGATVTPWDESGTGSGSPRPRA